MIKRELQAVAEGVAASVLQSSTPSNADLSIHGRSESPSSTQWNAEFESADAGKDTKDKFEVLNSLTQLHVLLCKLFIIGVLYLIFACIANPLAISIQETKAQFPERANFGFPVSDGIGRLQVRHLLSNAISIIC